MGLVSKQTRDVHPGDKTYLRNQPFAYFMFWLGRRQLLLLFTHLDDRSVLKWMVILPLILPLGRNLGDIFGG